MPLSDEIKARISLRAVAEKAVAWDAHKSAPRRGDWWAPCPFHGEATASFHVTEPQGHGGTFYCFGCQARGSVIDFVMARDGLNFAQAVHALADTHGVDRTPDPARLAKIKAESEARRKEAAAAAAARAARGHRKAAEIWRAAVVNHPALIAYLEGRGIDLGAIGGVPPTLRYHPDLPCHDGEDAHDRPRLVHRGPAMVAFIGRHKLLGVHRTWIDGPARARLACGRKVPKQMLGRTGAIYGAPVCLTRAGGAFLIVGEGIETTLAGLMRARRKGLHPSAEAALSLGAMCGPEDRRERPGGLGRAGHPLPAPRPDPRPDRPGWLPPEGTPRVLVLADPSTKCPETARLNAERARAKAAARCPGGARLAVPRGHWDHNDDFADLALMGDLDD